MRPPVERETIERHTAYSYTRVGSVYVGLL
jgi:hypothetical protein